MTISLTRDLTRLIREKPVEKQDLEQAAVFVLDAAVNIIAGTRSEPGRRFLSWARELRMTGPVGLQGDAARNAFLLGALCHILELDDLHRQSITHPGCTVVAALWGMAAANRAPIGGGRALTAVLHGYEAMTRIGRCVGPAHYQMWHNTATCGPFGAAAAAAHLTELDEDTSVHGLGNAGTQAAGLWEFLETGAMSKHLHAGRAAEAGVTAALLAKHGVTGAPKILEGSRAFFAAMCPDANPDLLLSEPDCAWQLHGTSLKPWPSCRHTHPTIDAALELRNGMATMGLGPEAIEAIQIGVYDAALALCNNPSPRSAYTAKFSLQHCVAAALADGDVWFESFEDRARDRLAGLRGRAYVDRAAAVEQRFPASWGVELKVSLADGQTLRAQRLHAKGDPELPLSTDDVTAKATRVFEFRDIAPAKPFIDAVLAMAEGAPLPQLPQIFDDNPISMAERATE